MSSLKKGRKPKNPFSVDIQKRAEEEGVSYGTAWNRINKLHGGKSGGQALISDADEKIMADILLNCARFGVPLGMPMLKRIYFQTLIKNGEVFFRIKRLRQCKLILRRLNQSLLQRARGIYCALEQKMV